jgi:ribonuclease J
MNWNKKDLLFAPLGGSGEIGMNANLYHYDGAWMMVDLGINFPDDSMPGVDVVLPDLRFLDDKTADLVGLVITHGHEDHLGAVPYLWKTLRCPVYGTAFTLSLLRQKLIEHGLEDDIPLKVIDYNRPISVGPFAVEMIALTHSIPDPAGLIIKAGGEQIFHTGDWKFDDDPQLGPLSDLNRLKTLGDDGVLAMIGDSTNAMVEGSTESENMARQGLIDTISKQKGRVAVTCFASNVARLNSLVEVARQTDRSPMLIGRALNRVVEAARYCGYLKDWPDMLSMDDFNLIPRENILMICSGSQGEPRSAMTRIAMGTHHLISLEEGDTVLFSSREIPGNEAAIGKVQDCLITRGIKVITADDAPIHVSGHPARDDMTAMYQMIRPDIAIPVHGTSRHVRAHAQLAKDCQIPNVHIPENGQVIRLSPGPIKVIGGAETGLMTIEGGDIIPLHSAAMQSRRKMMWNGTVTASLVLSERAELCASPMVTQNGIVDGDKASCYLAEAILRIEDEFANMGRSARYDDRKIEDMVAKALRGLAKMMADRRPVIQVHIMRVSALDAGE